MCFSEHLEGNDPKEVCFSSADTLMMFLAVLLSVTKEKAVKVGSCCHFDPRDYCKRVNKAGTSSTVKTVRNALSVRS